MNSLDANDLATIGIPPETTYRILVGLGRDTEASEIPTSSSQQQYEEEPAAATRTTGVTQWLSSVGLTELAEHISSAGIERLSDLCQMSQIEFEAMGVPLELLSRLDAEVSMVRRQFAVSEVAALDELPEERAISLTKGLSKTRLTAADL